MAKRTQYIHIRITPEEKEALLELQKIEHCETITDMLLEPLRQYMRRHANNEQR